MVRQSKLLSFLFSEQLPSQQQTWFKTASLTSFFSLLFLYFVHISVTLNSKDILDRHTFNIFEKSQQLDFQIKNSFSLSKTSDNGLCSPNDFQILRETLQKYYYLDDIGRISNGKILCTVKKGILASPILLNETPTSSNNGIDYWNNQNQLFNNINRAPMFSRDNTIAIISNAYMTELDLSNPIQIGSGGYFYLKNTDYIFKIYGKINTQHIARAKRSASSLSAFLLLPGSIISSNLCDEISDICLMSVITAHGIFNLPYLHLLLIILAIFIFSIVFSKLVISYQRGPNAFIRKLRKAIKSEDIYPVYQTKLCISSSQVTGVESLARWQDPSLGFISPDLFISVAEQANLIKPLTEGFVKKTFVELGDILEQNPEFTLSINVSADVLIDKQFLTFLKNECGKYQFKPSQIILEITERVSSNSSSMAEAATLSKQQGFLVSLDDFGTGYSNLAWLTDVEPDEIKIDKMFTQAIGTETVNSITLNGMFSMLDHLDVKVVFEGIETEQQMTYIKQRVPEAIGQGWFFSKPQPIAELLKQL